MKTSKFLPALVCFGSLLSCVNEKGETTTEGRADSEATEYTYHEVIPADFPSLDITGFNFPEDSVTLNGWIHNSDDANIYLHGWGIWTGLTSFTNQKIEGDTANLRVFETWPTPEEMITNIKDGSNSIVPQNRSNRANLRIPNQFTHFGAANTAVNESIRETVSYSPGAAQFAVDNKIFMATTLYNYSAVDGDVEIPFFPKNAITTKPVFKILPAGGGQTEFEIAVWPGTIDSLAAFPEKDWNYSVTVDITNSSNGADSVYNLSDFIHFKLNEEDADFFNQEFSENSGNKFDAQPGDIAILVGMHVGTREITNWTWQTFWWDVNPDNPTAPSSKAIADARPEQLKGAPRHYAMAVAYYMVDPNEPYEGENVTGAPNYAFNPYLEAGFGPQVFNDSISYVMEGANNKTWTYAGVRTNCMSCHRMATVVADNPADSKTPYVGNSYVSRADTLFDDQLLLDFAWSIQSNVDTTGLAAYIKEHSQQ